MSRAVKDQMVAMWASLDEAHLGQIDRPRIFKFLKSQGLSIDSEADVNVSVSFAVVLSPLAKCLSLCLSFSLFLYLNVSLCLHLGFFVSGCAARGMHSTEYASIKCLLSCLFLFNQVSL